MYVHTYSLGLGLYGKCHKLWMCSNLPIQVKALLLPCWQQLEQTRRQRQVESDAIPFPLINPIHTRAMVRNGKEFFIWRPENLGSSLTRERRIYMQLDVGKVVSLAQPWLTWAVSAMCLVHLVSPSADWDDVQQIILWSWQVRSRTGLTPLALILSPGLNAGNPRFP